MRPFKWAIVPIMFATASGASAADKPWAVTEASGDVRVVVGGQTKAVKRGALLASGSLLVTGAQARAVIVHGGDAVVVSQNSRLKIAEPSPERGIFATMVEYGTSLFRIKHTNTPHFGVKTPYLAAVVKGTTFTVNVGPVGSSVQVTEGAVEVATLDGGAADLITPGNIASVAASDRYQLRVDGDSSRVIRSNLAPATAAPAAESKNDSAAPASGESDASPAPAGSSASESGGAPAAEAEIGQAVAAAPVSLADVTGGLVTGNIVVELAMLPKERGNGGANQEPAGGSPAPDTISSPAGGNPQAPGAGSSEPAGGASPDTGDDSGPPASGSDSSTGGEQQPDTGWFHRDTIRR